MTAILASRASRTIELEAFVETVTPQAATSGAVEMAVDRAITDLSVEFNPNWTNVKKLAWLFVTNLESMPSARRDEALVKAHDAVATAVRSITRSR